MNCMICLTNIREMRPNTFQYITATSIKKKLMRKTKMDIMNKKLKRKKRENILRVIRIRIRNRITMKSLRSL